jgi:hypothetical protein
MMTRARYETVVFVPRGTEGDRTRDPNIYDGIANFLLACGVRQLSHFPSPEVALAPELSLL